jgi:hypothetical protein
MNLAAANSEFRIEYRGLRGFSLATTGAVQVADCLKRPVTNV